MEQEAARHRASQRTRSRSSTCAASLQRQLQNGPICYTIMVHQSCTYRAQQSLIEGGHITATYLASLGRSKQNLAKIDWESQTKLLVQHDRNEGLPSRVNERAKRRKRSIGR